MKNVKGIFVDADTGKISVKSIKGTLDSYDRLLKCDTFDIVTRKFGPYALDVFCDDEALLKDDIRVTAIALDNQSMLFGNLFIAFHDGEGSTISLEKEHIDYILKKCVVTILQDGKVRNVVVYL